jgi:hypothetical protein
MNPYEPPIQAELVPPHKPRLGPLEIAWRITILIVVGACLYISAMAWWSLL